MKTDLRPLLDEPDAFVAVTRHELLNLCIEADDSLDAGHEEHAVLGSIRERLGAFLEDPKRRAKEKGTP